MKTSLLLIGIVATMVSCKSASETFYTQAPKLAIDAYKGGGEQVMVYNSLSKSNVPSFDIKNSFDLGNRTAYVFFSPDSSRAEVVIERLHCICKRKSKSEKIWTSSKGNLNLQEMNNVWSISMDDDLFHD